MIVGLIRVCLTIVLLYFVYGETGWATTLCLGALCFANEVWAFCFKEYSEWAKVITWRVQ